MARSELNSLLDRAAEAEQVSHKDPDEDLYRRFSLDELTDAELEAEIERRHRERQAAARGRAAGAANTAGRPASGQTRTKPGPGPRAPSTDDELRRAYAALEVPVGADFATVRSSYRTLMRKYHPDRHAGSPDKQKTATELAQKLSQAYLLIEQRGRK